VVDRKGGYAICAVYESSNKGKCHDIYVNHNIAAGISMNGFWTMTLGCDEENTKFYGNIAHSIAGGDFGGNGAYFNMDHS
jgi:hypothetical protein